MKMVTNKLKSKALDQYYIKEMLPTLTKSFQSIRLPCIYVVP